MEKLSRNRNASTSRARILRHEPFCEIEVCFLAYEVLSGLPYLQRILEVHVLNTCGQRDAFCGTVKRVLNSRTIFPKLFKLLHQ